MEQQIQNELFGLLKYYGMPRYSETYETTLDFSTGESIRLSIDVTDINDQDLSALLQRARTTYLALQNKRGYLLQAIAEHHLPEYNLVATSGVQRSENNFLSFLKLESIHIAQDGSSSLYYETEGLEDYFGDHDINIDVDSEQRVTLID